VPVSEPSTDGVLICDRCGHFGTEADPVAVVTKTPLRMECVHEHRCLSRYKKHRDLS
jgi:hypothetical protein